MHRILTVFLVLLTGSTGLSAEKRSRLDLVPAHASASLIFRSANDFKEKGDKLLAATAGGMNWASMGIEFGAATLGVSKVYDPDQPFAVVWLNRSQVTLSEDDKQKRWRKPIAAVVAIRDLDSLASELKVDVQQLKDGKVVTQPGQMGYEHRHYKVSGDHLWIGSHIEAIDFAIDGERLSGFIAKSRRKDILENDVILCFSSEWDEFNPENAAAEADRWIKNHPDADAEEQAALREMFEIFQSARHAIFGFRIEPDGLQLDLDAHFDPASHETIRKAVRRISPKGEPATLAGLPANGKQGELIFAHAARTDGKATLAVASIILRDTFRIWTNWWSELEGRGFLNRSQQFEVLGLFTEVWRKLDGYRTGLYQNSDPQRSGLVSLVAILDTEDADDFIREMKELGGLVDGTSIDLEELPKEDSRSKQTIRKLVSQLAAPDYSTRQSASTKLILIGGPALKFVEKAEDSDNAEVARRARMIATRIRQSVKRKRDEALEPSLLSRIEPKFFFHENAAEREGHRVHVIEMRTKTADSVQENVAALLGPEWMKVRLVPLDGQVVVLLGSNTGLLDTALKNIARNRPGLAEDPLNSVYNRPLLKKHISELHFSIQRLFAMFDGKPLTRRESHELTSLALTLEPAYFNIEWRLPVLEIQRLMNRVMK